MVVKFKYWEELGGKFLDYLNDYPDHWTQMENLKSLKEHLRNLYQEFSNHEIPAIKKVEELEVG